MAQVELAHMTWKEVEAARDRGAVVLIPIGTQEQNGLVCPLATDGLIVFETARRVAQETGALVAPLVSYSYSARHHGFSGTISLQPETLRRLLVDICENLIADGFDHLLFVNSHETNDPIMEHVARDIRQRLGIILGYFSPMSLAEGASHDLFPSMAGKHGHGDERTASMLLSFVPESVRMDAAQPNSSPRDFEGMKVLGTERVKVGEGTFGLYLQLSDVRETGGNGNPAAADGKLGAELMGRVVHLAADYVRTFGKLRVRER